MEKEYRYNNFKIIVQRNDGKYNLVIIGKKKDPTYRQIKNIRYKFLPDNITMGMIFPPKKHFVNIHKRCFHLFELEAIK